jgi:hypothetical protein
MVEIILTGRQGREILELDPNLRKIFLDLLIMWPEEELAVTSIHRTEEENKAAMAKSRIHVVGPPYRAMDIRVRNLGIQFQEKAEDLAKRLNALWQYDPERPTKPVAYAKPHGTGSHLHCQSHPRTVRRS